MKIVHFFKNVLSLQNSKQYHILKSALEDICGNPKKNSRRTPHGVRGLKCKYYEKGNGCPEDCALFDHEGYIDDTDDFCQGKRPIIRAPQSFYYVEKF